MKRGPVSIWDRLQLLMLRLLSIVLALVDGLFRVRCGERILDRLTNRWQAQVAELDKALVRLEQERERLNIQVDALAIHAAALYLGSRSLARSELRFDPADPRDEEALNASIELLVKERLAAIETEEIEPGYYVYNLEPDWAAIRTRLARAVDHAGPEVAEWFCEGLSFIDNAFLSGAST